MTDESGASAGQHAGQQAGQQTGSASHGSLSEEAAKLAETLQAWLNTGAAMGGVGTSSECRVCPFCQLLGVLRGTKPEVLAHLMEAGTALAAAVRSMTEASEKAWTSANRPPVQHINVT
jgi:hypothetical protein